MSPKLHMHEGLAEYTYNVHVFMLLPPVVVTISIVPVTNLMLMEDGSGSPLNIQVMISLGSVVLERGLTVTLATNDAIDSRTGTVYIIIYYRVHKTGATLLSYYFVIKNLLLCFFHSIFECV